MIKTKNIEAGNWVTVEWFWNVNASAFFREPSGAHIKVRYGVGWAGFDRQKQTLNGVEYKKLGVGLGSLGRARMQVKVDKTTEITYSVYTDGVARLSPEIKF